MGYTPWTAYATFTINKPVVVLNAPTGTLPSWDKTFRWTGIPSAEYYHTQVYDGLDNLVQEEWYTLSICSGLECAVNPAETRNLANGDYKWRVQTYGTEGYTSWTEFATFTLNKPVVVLNAPIGTLNSWDNSFRWTGIPSAKYYHTQVYDATTNTLVQEEWYTTSICTALDCAVSPAETLNLANGEYKWRVQTYGTEGYTPFTAFMNFILEDTLAPAAITDLSAATGSTTGTIDLSWTAPGDDGMNGTATSYLVRYSASEINSEFDWDSATPVSSGVPTPQATGATETMAVPGLTAGTTYFFAVRAEDEIPNLGQLSNSPSAVAGTGSIAITDHCGTITADETWGQTLYIGSTVRLLLILE